MSPMHFKILREAAWKLNVIRGYQDSGLFEVTPTFIFSEIVSKTKRAEHYSIYKEFIKSRRLEQKSMEEKLDLLDAGSFAKDNFKVIPSMNRNKLLDYAISKISLEGIWVEFGVYRGESLNYISKKTKNLVHGFDSFQGLPDDWNIYHSKGHFKLENGKLPKVRKNAELHVGLFSETLPDFVEENNNLPMAFIHIDCDLYTSTKDVFGNLAGRIRSGTIIVFDEYTNYVGWRKHEYLAFQEFCSENQISFEYIGYNDEAEQVAVRIL